MNPFFQDEDQRNAVSPMEVDFQDPNFLEAMAQRTAMANPFTQQQALQAIAPQQFGAPQIPQGGTPPFNPNAPDPRQQPPQGQQGGMGAFLNSPELAMASQAANNIFAARKDQPTRDPVQVYQQAVQNQAIMKLRDAQAARADAQAKRAESAEGRAREKFEIDKNPMYEFEQFVDKQGLQDEPFQTQLAVYQQFQRAGLKGASDTSQIKNLAQRKAMQDSIEAGDGRYTQDDLDKFDESVVKSQWLNQGDVYGNPRTGEQLPIGLKPEDVPAYLRKRALTEKAATMDADFAAFVDNGELDSMEQALQNTSALRQAIIDGGYQETGPIQGAWSLITGDTDAAVMNLRSVAQALQNLQITNLAPVTENEIKMIESLYANIDRSPEQNIALLEEAERMLQDKMDLINKKGTYYTQNGGTLQGYGTSRWSKQQSDTPKVSGPPRPQ